MTRLQEAPPLPRWEPVTSPARSRAAQSTALRVFRPRRSVPAIVAALCVAGTGGAVVLLSMGRLGVSTPVLGQHDRLLGASVTPWESPEAMIASASAAALGLALIVTALVPGAGTHSALRTDDRDTVVGLSGGALRSLLGGAVHGVDGVLRARVRVGRRSVRITVYARGQGADGLSRRVEAVVGRRLDELAPLRSPRVAVRVRREE